MEEHVTVNDEVAGSSPASTAFDKPSITISQDGHKIFAVMGFTNEKKIHKIAIHRLPRQFLHMDEDQQKWFLNSQGIAKKLLKKLELK